MTTTTSKIDLPPPAWGSPAHLAQRKAEKEWKQHLRAHATADVEKKAKGRHARYVDAVDIVVRYTLPPNWDGIDVESEWTLPADDELLIKVLQASFTPFFQRTGEFSKPSSAFKTPPVSKPTSQRPSPTTTPAPAPEPVLAPPPTTIVSTTMESLPTVTPPPTITITPTPYSQDPIPATSSAEPNKDQSSVQRRPSYLPPILASFFGRVGQVFLWMLPNFLRARLNMWWSPVLRTGSEGYGHGRV
ncbi:hypothetical protein FRC14_005128 [Serendipita sp. 396]|nr:hypothetical protein FRC14_005128 [Serendipita sp. 396]KAG8789563.1 hypothetical protein FRC15_006295 [Serendipita sp. 397]KAG8872608.1 hypothetical protein FRC20_009268 [Serendipita sp. 405]